MPAANDPSKTGTNYVRRCERHQRNGAACVVAGGYSRAEFERLITQGVPTGNRKISEMMSGVAKTRFAHLTRHERDALYAYLKARAEKAD